MLAPSCFWESLSFQSRARTSGARSFPVPAAARDLLTGVGPTTQCSLPVWSPVNRRGGARPRLLGVRLREALDSGAIFGAWQDEPEALHSVSGRAGPVCRCAFARPSKIKGVGNSILLGILRDSSE